MNKEIFECCNNYDLESLKKLLAENPFLVNEKNENGETPLICACTNFHGYHDNYNPEVIQALLDAGSDIYAKDKNGDDAFISSLYCGADYFNSFHFQTPELLLKAGYRLNKGSRNFKKAQEHAMEWSRMCDCCSCSYCVEGWIGNNWDRL